MNMKINNTIIAALLVAALVTITSCKPSRDKSLGQIRSLEQRLFSPEASGFDKVKADSLMTLYKEFIDRFPKDTLSPGFLFRSANIAMNSGNGIVAIEQFDRYLKEFPDGSKAPLCLFFKAFVYENLLKNMDKAKESYLLFIEQYPGNAFAKDAEMALQNLGKTPDQIVKEFEEKRKADSIRVADSVASLKKAKTKKR